MVEVKITELKYIRDIPVEMLQAAVDAGEVRKGKIIGLMVRPVGMVSEGDVLIELKLTEDGQEEVIKPGAIIPVDSSGSICVIRPEWKYYLNHSESSGRVELNNLRIVVSRASKSGDLSPKAAFD